MLTDLVNEVLSGAGFNNQTITAATTGTTIDMANGTAAIGAILDVNNVSGTDPSLTVQIEESDDLSTWSAISGMVFNAVTSGPSHQVVRGLRQKRYVRPNALTVTGTTPSFVATCEIIEQKHQVNTAGAGGGYDTYPS